MTNRYQQVTDSKVFVHAGKSNMVTGLAKSIRLYFQKHPLAIVGVKGRAKGTPVEEIIQQIEVLLQRLLHVLTSVSAMR